MRDEGPAETLPSGFDWDALRDDEGVVLTLDRDDHITWVNEAWARFARENGGASLLARYGVGASYLDGIRGPLAEVFARAFASVRTRGEPWEFEYESSSPEAARRHRVRVLPASGELLLVEHHPVDGEALGEGGEVVVQCSDCGKVRRAGAGWRWLPSGAGMTAARAVSHGLCAACAGRYVERVRQARWARRGGGA